MTPEQLKKLPKYAQNEIERLRRDNDALRDEIAKAETGETNTWLRRFRGNGRDDVGLPPNSQIRFDLANTVETYVDVQVMKSSRYLAQEHLQIMASDVLYVRSMASNLVAIEVPDRWKDKR